jgi:hypothetical protein
MSQCQQNTIMPENCQSGDALQSYLEVPSVSNHHHPGVIHEQKQTEQTIGIFG